MELKFEVKVKFQTFNPHPIFHVAKNEHKTTPAPFDVILNDVSRDPELHDLEYDKIVFYNPYSCLKYTTSSYQMHFFCYMYTTLPFNFIAILFLLLQLMTTNIFHLMIQILQVL